VIDFRIFFIRVVGLVIERFVECFLCNTLGLLGVFLEFVNEYAVVESDAQAVLVVVALGFGGQVVAFLVVHPAALLVLVGLLLLLVLGGRELTLTQLAVVVPQDLVVEAAHGAIGLILRLHSLKLFGRLVDDVLADLPDFSLKLLAQVLHLLDLQVSQLLLLFGLLVLQHLQPIAVLGQLRLEAVVHLFFLFLIQGLDFRIDYDC